MPTLTGHCYWANVHTARKGYDGDENSSKYSIDIEIESGNQEHTDFIKKLKMLKAKQTTKVYDKGPAAGKEVFSFKRNERTKAGKIVPPPAVVDSKKNPIKDLVGNGSLVKVLYSLQEYEFKGSKGTKVVLEAVQVLDLVEYSSRKVNLDELKEEDGYVAINTPLGEHSIDDLVGDLDENEWGQKHE